MMMIFLHVTNAIRLTVKQHPEFETDDPSFILQISDFLQATKEKRPCNN